ncbi:PfkB family carbohydrate kinase [Rubrolithibacter danxiaensis]|uniref:PfkB family carbohydrate kinase n=1 Tax=Rubrolithibacter danxiaensis TaxID=3390805 RepID=UPI003BF91686
MKDNLQYLQECLFKNGQLLQQKKVTAGFDGFVDSIVKVISDKSENSAPVFFEDIEEFGNYISAKKGSGFSLETEELFQKLGGNMPIMANALAEMGVKTDCIGAFGVPSFHPVFTNMHPGCRLFSFTNPGFTSALEFNDGKIMLAQMKDLNNGDWQTIRTAIGLEKIIESYNNSDLFCLVNWSELDHSNSIWLGLLDEVLPSLNSPSNKKKAFFDLSDCSKRSSEKILDALNLIRRFSAYCDVILSMNKNEAQLVYKALSLPGEVQQLEQVAGELYKAIHIDTLVIHNSAKSVAWNKKGVYQSTPDFIANPKISTGAGDNFNAGYCIAMLMDLDPDLSLLLANTVASFYMQNAKSPCIPEMLDYISKKHSSKDLKT